MKTMFLGHSTSLRSDDVVIHGPLRMWAERGLIHIEDDRDNSYEAISIRECLQRVRANSDMLGNSSEREKGSEDQFDRANRKRIQDMIDAMISVVRKAQIQGSPDDASARADLKRRRSKTFIIPGNLAGL